MPATLRIDEIFWSFQGEGCRSGYPSIFVRLGGCNLRCPYCDTPGSWMNPGTPMSENEIMDRIDSLYRQYPGSQLVITGGEPLEQDLAGLVVRAKKRGMYLAVETNGTLFQDLIVDWWAVSPKGERNYFIHPGLNGRIDEIKLVVTPNLKVGDIRGIQKRFAEVPIFLQPDVYSHGQKAYAMAYDLFCRAAGEGIEMVRAGMQLHRIFGVP